MSEVIVHENQTRERELYIVCVLFFLRLLTCLIEQGKHIIFQRQQPADEHHECMCKIIIFDQTAWLRAAQHSTIVVEERKKLSTSTHHIYRVDRQKNTYIWAWETTRRRQYSKFNLIFIPRSFRVCVLLSVSVCSLDVEQTTEHKHSIINKDISWRWVHISYGNREKRIKWNERNIRNWELETQRNELWIGAEDREVATSGRWLRSLRVLFAAPRTPLARTSFTVGIGWHSIVYIVWFE